MVKTLFCLTMISFWPTNFSNVFSDLAPFLTSALCTLIRDSVTYTVHFANLREKSSHNFFFLPVIQQHVASLKCIDE